MFESWQRGTVTLNDTAAVALVLFLDVVLVLVDIHVAALASFRSTRIMFTVKSLDIVVISRILLSSGVPLQ